jgi:hypothetical protein
MPKYVELRTLENGRGDAQIYMWSNTRRTYLRMVEEKSEFWSWVPAGREKKKWMF